MPAVPTHGPLCETTTWPTDCPNCGQSVFYFSCTCGSGVFFDHLGPPWPIHHHGDSSDYDPPPWLVAVIRRINPDGDTIAELTQLGVSVIKPAHSAGNATSSPNPPRRDSSSKPPPIVAVPPGESEMREFTGMLREITRSVNPMPAFGYDDDGPMAVAMTQAILGSRWVAKFGKITVHTPRSNSPQLESYTAWIPATLIKSPRIKPGITVSVTLTSVDISHRYRDWYCDRFRVVR